MGNSFNLLEEKWIPTSNRESVSLMHIFSDSKIRSLGGNSIEKIALFKFFLAIAQRALRVKTRQELYNVSNLMIAEKCKFYLEKNKEKFYLYGKEPFLQMKQVYPAKLRTYNHVNVEVATGNTSVLYSSQRQREFDDAEKALFVLTHMSFGFGGKKPDNSVVLTPGYQGKMNDKGNPSSSRSCPSLGYKGYLHSFLLGETLIDSIRLNLFPEEEISEMKFFPQGIGVPPWEDMPGGEADDRAVELRESYIGWLVPLSRFMLLTDEGVHLTEGINFPSIYDGFQDLSLAIDDTKKKIRTLWAEPDYQPLKNMKDLLSFLGEEKTLHCPQITNAYKMVEQTQEKCFYWCGGIRVSSKAGEQYCSGMDDYIEKQMLFNWNVYNRENFVKTKQFMDVINKYESIIFFSVKSYYKDLNLSHLKYSEEAKEMYWTLVEENLQPLVDLMTEETDTDFRRLAYSYVKKVYDFICPPGNQQRTIAWAKNNPTVHKDGKNERRKETQEKV